MAQPAAVGSSVNKDLGYKVDAAMSIGAIVGNNTAEGTGLAVDLKGYEGAVALVHFGISGDTLSGAIKALVSIQHSVDGSTGWADLATTQYRVDTFLNASVASPTITRDTTLAEVVAAAGDDVLYKITILPGPGVRRYVRALITFTGTHTNGTPISAVFLRGFARKEAAGIL